MVRRLFVFLACSVAVLLLCPSLHGQAVQHRGGRPQQLSPEEHTVRVIQKCLELKATVDLLNLLDGPNHYQSKTAQAVQDLPVNKVCNAYLTRLATELAQKERRRRVVAKCDELTATGLLILAMDDPNHHGWEALSGLKENPTFEICKRNGWTLEGFKARNPSLASKPNADAPPPPQKNGQPWSWYGMGLSHTDYIGYTANNGQYIKPAPPYNTHIDLSAEWNDKLGMYKFKMGCNTIYSKKLSFDFDDKCNQNAKTPVPNCAYKCRDDYTVHGHISIDGPMATYTGAFFDNAAPGGGKKGKLTCTFEKKK